MHTNGKITRRREAGSLFTERLHRSVTTAVAALPRVPDRDRRAAFAALDKAYDLDGREPKSIIEFAAERSSGMAAAAGETWPDSGLLAALALHDVHTDELREPHAAWHQLAAFKPELDAEISDAIDDGQRIHARPILRCVGAWFAVASARAVLESARHSRPSTAMLQDAMPLFFALEELGANSPGIGAALDEDPATQGLVQSLVLDLITFVEVQFYNAPASSYQPLLRLPIKLV